MPSKFKSTKSKPKSTFRRFYRKAIHPYVNKRKGYRNRMKLYQEVNSIKRMINAEKKTAIGTLENQSFAQTYNGVDGCYATQLFPTITQETGYSNRTGRSIRLSGLYMRARFSAQTNNINRTKFNVLLVRAPGLTQTPSEVLDGMFLPDQISTYRDLNCSRNPDKYTDYRIIASKTYFLAADQISTEVSYLDVAVPLKLNFHVRYQEDTNTITEGMIYIILRADRGDAGTALTGIGFNISYTYTYFDN